MPHSVIEAIKSGLWDYEPAIDMDSDDDFSATEALPGTDAKLEVLATRVESGLPLWHPSDRLTFDARGD